VDPYGLATLVVGKCEVIVFYGHGSRKQPHKFKFAHPSCSAGEFVGCYPGVTNRGIPENNRLCDPDLREDVQMYDGIATDLFTDGDDSLDFQKQVMRALNRAREKARAICGDKQKCCKVMTVSVKRVSGFWNWLTLPNLDRLERIPCEN